MSELLGVTFFGFHELQYAERQMPREGWNVILAQYGLAAFVQRISNFGEIQYITLTPDKVLKVLRYGLAMSVGSFHFNECNRLENT